MRWKDLQSFCWYPELSCYTFDTACQLFLGIKTVSPVLKHLFSDWSKGLFSIPLPLPNSTFSRAMRSRQLLLKEIEMIVQQRQAVEDYSGVIGTLLQARDETGNTVSMDVIKEQLLTLLFAGHETLSSAMTSFCWLVAQYPEVASALYAEQLAVDGRGITLQSFKQMPYLDAVLKEILRLIPPVAGGFRKVICECDFAGYRLPKNWQIIFQIDRTHLDGGIYATPEQFNPNRFLSKEKSKPFAHAPYGGGIHECLGKDLAQLQMTVLASLLIRSYVWEVVPDQDLSVDQLPTPRPKSGLVVNFRCR